MKELKLRPKEQIGERLIRIEGLILPLIEEEKWIL